MRVVAATAACLALLAAGCASRRPAPPAARAPAPPPGRSAEEIRAGFEANKQRVPHLTMLSQEEAHKAMPNLFKGGDMPTLALVGAHQPRSMEAVLNVAKASRREGGLDGKLLNDVFWAVSSANDCFYWMGHVDFMAAVSGLPSTHVFTLEQPGSLDAKRRLALPFARKLTKEPAQIRQADIDALKAEFSEKEIVQLIFAICHFNTMNRLADAFGVPLEKTNVFAQKPKAMEPKQPPIPEAAP